MTKQVLAMVLAVAAGGCTRWGTVRVHGAPSEVARTPVGAPHVATTRSSSLAGGVAGVGFDDGLVAAANLGVAGHTDSISRQHCVQEARIDYVQPYEDRPAAEGRAGDVGGGLLVAAAGLTVIAVSAVRSHTIFEPGDPLYEEPPDPTAGYMAGGVAIGAGLGWIAVSYAMLPTGKPPAATAGERRWSETRLVEATGCGLVPADQSANRGDVEERLRRLDELHAKGLLTDGEYRAKRKQLLDQL